MSSQQRRFHATWYQSPSGIRVGRQRCPERLFLWRMVLRGALFRPLLRSNSGRSLSWRTWIFRPSFGDRWI